MADEPLAALTELTDRLDWELSDDEIRTANNHLIDASRWARHYGRQDWTIENCPPLVRTVVVGAVKRHMRNPDGATQSRAGDETLGIEDRVANQSAEVRLTASEIQTLYVLAGKAQVDMDDVVAVPLTAWRSRRRPTRPEHDWGWVPTQHGGSVPLYSNPDDPW